MGYIDRNLIPNEKVMYETRLHWVVMLGHIVWAILLTAGGAALLYYANTVKDEQPSTVHGMEWGGAVLLLLALVAIVMGVVRRNATEMAVTDRRVVVKTGVASVKTIEMLLNRVESIEVTQNVGGRMWGYGTIRLIGTGGTNEPFPKIAHPLEFRSQVQQQIEKHPQIANS